MYGISGANQNLHHSTPRPNPGNQAHTRNCSQPFANVSSNGGITHQRILTFFNHHAHPPGQSCITPRDQGSQPGTSTALQQGTCAGTPQAVPGNLSGGQGNPVNMQCLKVLFTGSQAPCGGQCDMGMERNESLLYFAFMAWFAFLLFSMGLCFSPMTT